MLSPKEEVEEHRRKRTQEGRLGGPTRSWSFGEIAKFQGDKVGHACGKLPGLREVGRQSNFQRFCLTVETDRVRERALATVGIRIDVFVVAEAFLRVEDHLRVLAERHE